MKQYEAVAEVMRQNGGYATFALLYAEVLKVPGCDWKTKTPFHSIRRIVQQKPDLFFKIRPGLWGLADHKEAVVKRLELEATTPTEAAERGHSYYQGLAVQIGNLRGYQTCVPPQDRNRRFLTETLASLVTLPEVPPFTYDHLVRRARTIDVTWINQRRLPGAFLEIEHSTDMNNALLKFLVLRDFRARFYVVADTARRAEFESKVQQDAFSPIRSLVRFVDYELLSEYHAKAAAMRLLERRFEP